MLELEEGAYWRHQQPRQPQETVSIVVEKQYDETQINQLIRAGKMETIELGQLQEETGQTIKSKGYGGDEAANKHASAYEFVDMAWQPNDLELNKWRERPIAYKPKHLLIYKLLLGTANGLYALWNTRPGTTKPLQDAKTFRIRG